MDIEWQKGQSLLIKGSEFYLKSLTNDDVTEQYISWMNDPEILKYINSRHRDNNFDTVCSYVERHDNKTSFHVGIFVCETDQHIGNFSFYVNEANETAQINVLIGEKEWWGKNVVLKTREMVLRFLFENLNVFKICGTTIATNIPSIFNYKKQGFTVEGILKKQVLLKDKSREDVIQFALFRDDWQPIYS